MTRLQIAGELLGTPIEPGGFAPCPGRDLHSKADGKRDFRVVLDGAPTGYCFHDSCGDRVAEFNRELRRRIWFAEHGRAAAPAGSWGHVAAEPKKQAPARPAMDEYQIWEFTRGVPEVDEEWLGRRSAVPVAGIGAADFLGAIYAQDERVLVFTDQRSQGDFVAWIGRGSYRLSQQRGVKAVPSPLPSGAPEGVWFLTQPVSGAWSISRDARRFSEESGSDPKWTRRSQVNVTAWRFFVLESDELEARAWLRVLVNLPLPIAAIYTSGGRSIHALVRCEVASKAEWDATRNVIRQIACPLGADPAALTAVRLSRLPCCTRGGKMQRLLYLNPNPDHRPIRLLPEARPGSFTQAA